MNKSFLALLLLTCTGCVTAHLTPAGRQIIVLGTAPDADKCTNLGTLTGQGGGVMGGVYISNDRLIDYAYNDLKNKAAMMHATHVQVSAPVLGSYDGTTSSASVTGIAFRCEGADKQHASSR